MAQHEHLPLRRLEGELQRRKRGGFAGAPQRDPKAHGPAIEAAIDRVLESQKAKLRIADIDPSLILKIRLAAPVAEEEWSRLGLTLLATDPNQTLVLFADDNELQGFRARVAAYQAEPPAGQKHPQYEGFVTAISEVSSISPQDRMGPNLAHEGIANPEDFSSDRSFTLDVELWQPSTDMAAVFIQRVATRLEETGGNVISEYRGNAALLMRIEGNGDAIRAILELPEVAQIDLQPVADLPPDELGQLAVEDLGDIGAPDGAALVIGIVDSGLTSAHPLIEQAVVSSFGAPEGAPANDEKGHGTPVAGIAAYGDLRGALASDEVAPRFRVASARVVNNQGRFDDTKLVPELMEMAIRQLHEVGCRVINISLGDRTRQAADKPSAWAAILDDLARELDLLIVVSAGNADRTSLNNYGDGIVAAYPGFLFDQSNRILEPGTAVNVVTVGAIANSNGLSEEDGEFVGVQPITVADQPSPFTRVGPGIGGMIKPDLVDYGGTALFDGATQTLIDGKIRPAAGVASLHNLYLERLFTSVSGTSFAAPLVAYKAALIRESFPDASANLARALLALSADVPEAALQCLENNATNAMTALGYGVSNIESALFSDDSRVVLFREDSLPIDKFAIYEIPIPEVFQTTRGKRHIRVALAYDPPVRHTRIDYCGIEMSFDLVRGATEEEVFNHFRKWEQNEGEPFKFPNRRRCKMFPGSQKRGKGSLQCATFTASTNISNYGNRYFLAVRCEGGWASALEEEQRFAVAVELRHQGAVELYQRVRERVRLRA